jgi:CBS domain-containing protein
MAEDFPVIGQDTDAWEAVTLLAEHRLPGLVVTDHGGQPHTILPGVLSESMADRVADKLKGKTVRALTPADPPELAVVNDDDTIVEVAAVMARLQCPLAAVMAGRRLVGVITAARLLQLALTAR